MRAYPERPARRGIGATPAPQVYRPLAPDTRREDWAPAHVPRDGTDLRPAVLIALQVGSPELAAFAPQVWVAGEPGATVSLRWETWEPRAPAGSRRPLQHRSPSSMPASTPMSPRGVSLQGTALPFDDHDAGQMVLYAERNFSAGLRRRRAHPAQQSAAGHRVRRPMNAPHAPNCQPVIQLSPEWERLRTAGLPALAESQRRRGQPATDLDRLREACRWRWKSCARPAAGGEQLLARSALSAVELRRAGRASPRPRPSRGMGWAFQNLQGGQPGTLPEPGACCMSCLAVEPHQAESLRAALALSDACSAAAPGMVEHRRRRGLAAGAARRRGDRPHLPGRRCQPPAIRPGPSR
ncbi:MAG: hypothetical protein MZW92_65600 [Comamonadaceae bacterium]|nr:hypothetical protein [Comamonadaceae bacterium]